MRKCFVFAVCMLYLVVACSCAWGDVPLDEAHFPDQVFREKVAEKDRDHDGVLSDEEISKTTSLSLYPESNGMVYSLKGIEYLTALTFLLVDDMGLTELDLSRNTALTYLWCHRNHLTRLDLSNNTALKQLLCDGNKLTELDLSKNTALVQLHCNDNTITSLNVSGCRFLQDLFCYNNQLATIDTSGCPALMTFYCDRNSLNRLDLSSNNSLRFLSCSQNKFAELDLSSNTALVQLSCSFCGLTELNLRNNTALRILDCSYNNISDLDLSCNTALVNLKCVNNSLTELDLSRNTQLVKVDCGRMMSDIRPPTQTLNVSGCSSLVELDCSSNNLETLDLSTCSALAKLDCGSNYNLAGLNLYGCPNLVILDTLYCLESSRVEGNCPKLAVVMCDETTTISVGSSIINRTVEVSTENFPDKIFREYVSTEIDEDKDGYLSPEEIGYASYIHYYFSPYDDPAEKEKISSLKGIEYLVGMEGILCSKNNISELDLSNCPLIDSIILDENKLTELDVSGCVALETLMIDKNFITELDASNHPMLRYLECEDNQLRTLNADNCTILQHISCSSCRLTSLNVKNCSVLDDIICNNNNLTELDLSTTLNLDSLQCHDNQLTKLDVSNTALTNLGCSRNPLVELNARNCIYIRELWCYETDLVTLDISNCPALEILSVYKNNLANLNVSGNTALKTLNCWDNKLSTLDVRNCTNLLGLFCSGNQLTDIDTSANTLLEELSCARNNLRTLNLSHNTALTSLYCYDNQLKNINLNSNTKLESLACSDNQIIDLDLSANTALVSLDCSANYLNELDLTGNTELETLTCRYTTLRSLNVKGLAKLAELNVERGSLTMLNLTGNPALKSTSLSGSRYEGLYLTHTENTDYPYQTDMRLYVGDNLAKASKVLAFDRTGGAVSAKFDASEGVVRFAAMPVRMTYDYDTGLADSPAMSVTVSIPTRSFIYLPKVQPSVYGVDESVHEPNISTQTDSTTGKTTVTVTYAAHYVGHASLYDVLNESDDVYEYVYDYADEEPDERETPIVPEPESPDKPASHDVTVSPDVPAAPSSGSGGGGCDSGFGILSACVLAFLPLRKRSAVFALVILGLTAGTIAGAEVRQSDYTLPIQLEDYTPAGTWTTNFALTPELVNTVAAIRRISADKVRSYSEIAAGTWEVEPSDLYNLARNGEYGGVTLPLTRSGTGDNFYVILCTFSNDVKPGELLSVQGFEVSADTRQSVYSREHSYAAASWVTLDDTFTRIEAVPENRRVYLAVSFRPEYVNTGILTVVRGTYVEEDNPLERLDDDIAKLIAEDLGISPDKLQYVSRAYLSDPREPTPAMLEYVKSNDREIVLNLPTVSIDAGYEGVYFNYRFPDDVWAEIKGKDLSEYMIYAMNDSEVSASVQRVKGASILNTVGVLFDITGGRLDRISTQDVIIAGLIPAAKSFSYYLVKTLILLLLGGCSTGINHLFVNAVILALIVLKFPRKH